MLFIHVICLLGLVSGQGAGTLQQETHPKLDFAECDASGCKSFTKEIVLDSNWRWVHDQSGTNCYSGNSWDSRICPDVDTCTDDCYVDGAGSYENTYGVKTSGDALTVKFVTHGNYGDNVGSRMFLMDNDQEYYTFALLNKEFTFDIDVSELPCGLNGAIYFVEMDKDGGMAKYPTNKAGAKYGTGYCDAQCPHDLKFISGEANMASWAPNPNDTSSGTGHYGSCCTEMDIWEANTISTAYTPHPCDTDGPYRCEGVDCGDNSAGDRYNGVCDKNGCDFNTFRNGNKLFYGPGATYQVDSTKKFTVVTQFLTDDGTESGNLKEIRRLYVQDGNVIENPAIIVPGGSDTPYDSITQPYCTETKIAYGETDSFDLRGGFPQLTEAFARESMVLVMSLWDDHEDQMLWLDSCDPPDAPESDPGVCRGTCPTSSGLPADVEKQHPDAKYVMSNIKFGDIGTTYTNDPVKAPTKQTTKPPQQCSPAYGQCGGQNWDGPDCCVDGSTCVVSNPYYSQCLPSREHEKRVKH